MNVTIISSGVELPLVDPFRLLDWEGLGAAELHRLSERGPQQHGDTDLGYLLDPRFVTLIVGLIGATPSQKWDLQAQLLARLHPSHLVMLKFELDNGATRQLDCRYSAGLTAMSPEDNSRFQRVGAILRAGDPTFYDPSGEAVTFQLGGGGGAWEFPWEIPWTVGASTIDQATAISYTGSAPSFPVIRITGPIDDCVITNETLGLKLDFTGVNIAGGDHYDIDLRYGSKTVVDAAGANKIADLTDDSDLATWRFAEDPDAPGGENSIRVAGTSITASTKIEIAYFTRFIGI
jgi:hypothetical protein